MSVDFFSAGGFSPHTMYYCVCLTLVPCFMRKHLEPLAELEDGCRVGPVGLFQENVSVHDSSALTYPAAAPGTERVWLTQALPCLLLRQSAHTYFCFGG